MQPFNTHTGRVAVLDRVNVDTDQIIPKQFLKRVERTGFGQFLFYDWRYLLDGTPNPDFELNAPEAQGATILIAGANFGCGSSREHAPWAILDYGFRVVVAPSFADIFYNNCFQNGILLITLPQQMVEDLMRRAAPGGYELTADLEAQTLVGSDGFRTEFSMDSFRRHALLHGLDDIELTLHLDDKIATYEARRPGWRSRGVPQLL
ncbi:MAG: 3-isopropylmalate dehydratase small subunit [Ardenticatenaceae bacterium]|nr:3-isopropylmalate dehydratase small subunit [Ardenticatenaceae bacterium]HBY95990.1 3-isopropylmalate dehydratase small subunit [Chloroflexota bacterium]